MSSTLRPWAVPVDEVARALATSTVDGLTSDDARTRLARDGPNELESRAPVPRWRRFAAQLNDPLVLLLLAAIVISLIAWASADPEEPPIEAFVIAIIVVFNAVMGYWQENKADQAVAALRRLGTTHVSAVRDGQVVRVPTAEVVVGDIVVLAEGDAVGADCRLVESASLSVSEAALTGESEPVEKHADVLESATPLAERANMAFDGTGVARGRGRAIVVATGMNTEIGRIAALLGETHEAPTPLQRQIAWLGRMLSITVVALSAVVVCAIVLTSDDRSLSSTTDALLIGVSLAVAAVPEGLPAILSVVLALGVQRMAGQRAVVKRLSSVETLGSASIICTDKTGTLTRNEMTIVKAVVAAGEVDLTGVGYEPVGQALYDGRPIAPGPLQDDVALLLRAGSLANDATLHDPEPGRWEIRGDPTEAAFLVAERKLGDAGERQRRYRRVAEVPFSSERKLMTTVSHDADVSDGERPDLLELMIVTKGAPDVLLDRCTHERRDHQVVPLNESRRVAIASEVDRLADSALRTLAVAYRRIDALDGPVDESIERDLVHLGVVGIVDPPRPEVAAAIDAAHRAGIEVMMITGDHPRTATRIAEQLGIDRVRARVEPAAKLQIVEELQASGHVVAMTGDGVNDAPALRRADIGVAMGINGTEVAKEAADMILVDDNFATILHAVREGREILADIRKVLRYLLASNTGEVLVVFLGVIGAGVLGLTGSDGGAAVPLLATQILWINLLTDGALALALGVDPAVDDVMARPPRRLDARVVDKPMMVTIALIGITSALAGLIALDLGLDGGMLGGSGDVQSARTMLFTTLVMAQIFNSLNGRSDEVSAFVRPFDNRLLWASIALAVVLQVAVVHLRPLQEAFDTTDLDARSWLICVGLGSSVLFVDEARKLLTRVIAPSDREAGPREAAVS